jgi:hypothetical protein
MGQPCAVLTLWPLLASAVAMVMPASTGWQKGMVTAQGILPLRSHTACRLLLLGWARAGNLVTQASDDFPIPGRTNTRVAGGCQSQAPCVPTHQQ